MVGFVCRSLWESVHAMPQRIIPHLRDSLFGCLLLRRKVPNSKELRSTFWGIIRSCIFLICHGVGYSGTACLLKRIVGSYNFYTASLVPSFLSSVAAILIERPSRRPLLSLYVTNVASETLFKMAVSRKIITPIPYGDMFVFSTSTAFLMYIYRRYGLPRDPAFSLLRFLVGPYEEHGYSKQPEEMSPPKSTPIDYKMGLFKLKMLQFRNWFLNQLYLVKCGTSHITCPHPYSCSYYILEGVSKKFFYGYVFQLCIKLFLNVKQIMKRPSIALNIPFWPETLRLAVTFSLFSGLYRIISCWKRHSKSEDSSLSAIPAGFIAGLSFYFYRENTIALYFMWKLLQLSYTLGVEAGYFLELPFAPVLFHALSTSVLFHTAVMEPTNLRPSYWNFLQAMSGGKIGQMGREGFDPYGLESSRQLAEVLARKKTK
uniref:Transmembrane protein 135 N-terminal domain-containing protein n=2 Tax=Lygus hesperus TaxID=30085 RepID=A0A0A9WZN0_LYGHE